MKSLLSLGLAAVLLISLSQEAYPDVNGRWMLTPPRYTPNLAAENFSITGPNGKESVSIFSTMPNVACGVDIGQVQGFLDLKAGAGILLNSSLYSYTVYGTAGWYQEIQPSVLFGPHIGICYYPAPDWWGGEDVEFSDSTGYLVGLHFAAGDKISYLLSVDYRHILFDIKKLPPGFTASDTSLDMSGVCVDSASECDSDDAVPLLPHLFRYEDEQSLGQLDLAYRFGRHLEPPTRVSTGPHQGDSGPHRDSANTNAPSSVVVVLCSDFFPSRV